MPRKRVVCPCLATSLLKPSSPTIVRTFSGSPARTMDRNWDATATRTPKRQTSTSWRRSHCDFVAAGRMHRFAHRLERPSSPACTRPASAASTCVAAITLPDDIQLYPEVLREAGYFCTNNSKTDYNFAKESGGWNESSNKAHWRDRPSDDVPFFAVFNFTVSHESKIRVRPHELKHDPAQGPASGLPSRHTRSPT